MTTKTSPSTKTPAAKTPATKSTTKPARKPASTKPAPEAKALRYFIDGRPVADVHNRLSGISRATALRGGDRLSTEDLRKRMAKAGITDPDGDPFEFTLPNGVVISAERETGTHPVRQPKQTTGPRTAAERRAAKDAKGKEQAAALTAKLAASKARRAAKANA